MINYMSVFDYMQCYIHLDTCATHNYYPIMTKTFGCCTFLIRYMSIEEWLPGTKKLWSFLWYLIKVYSLCYYVQISFILLVIFHFYEERILKFYCIWICVLYKKPAVKLASGINKNQRVSDAGAGGAGGRPTSLSLRTGLTDAVSI